MFLFACWIFKDRESTYRRGALDSMPFPPGVGGGRGTGDANIQSFEVITADRAIDENNVGNRMLRSMGWHEGSVPFLSLHFHGYMRFLVLLVRQCYSVHFAIELETRLRD